MNISYFEKIKRKIILLKKKKYFAHHKCGSARELVGQLVGRDKPIRPVFYAPKRGTGQNGPD